MIHVTSSVGWLGAVAGFFALALAGQVHMDRQVVQAAYVAMALLAWYVILPLSFSPLASGILQAWGTKWELFRHYWIVVKLLITTISTVLLLLHMQPISVAAEAALTGGKFEALQVQLIIQCCHLCLTLG